MPLQYERIADDLRRQIFADSLSAGARLAAETALASQYRVSVPTVRQALDVLQAEGLIEKRHGSGNFVRRTQERIEYTNVRFWLGRDPNRASSEEGALEAGDGIEVSVSLREIEACDGLSSRMGVPAGTRLVEYSYRSRRVPDGTPYVITRSYLVRDMLAGAPEPPDVEGSPWGDEFRQLLATTGVELDHVMERLTARPPSPEEAEALGISRGVAVLALQRTSFDAQGRVAEVADTVMSGDRVAAVYTTPLSMLPAGPLGAYSGQQGR